MFWLLSGTVINLSPRASWGGKGSFHLITYSPSLSRVNAETQDRNLEAGMMQRP